MCFGNAAIWNNIKQWYVNYMDVHKIHLYSVQNDVKR